MTPLEFLNQLWQYKPDDQYILIWTLPDKRSSWFTGVPEAAECVASINGSRDVYVGVGLSAKDYGPARRCVSDEVTAITGLASDFDLFSEAHSKKALPRTIEQALSILPPAMPPTIIIATGNGVHCWWLLKEPYTFDNEQDRKEVARLVTRWHTMLQFSAANLGWAYDRLSDLARVLRIPGTRNLKDPINPKDVVVHSFEDRHYNLGDFVDFLDAAGIPDPEAQERAAREWKEQFADKPITINADARIPQEVIDGWIQEDMRFKNTWLRQRHDLKDHSNSGYDMALACFGVDAGLSEQQIVDLIIHHRGHHGQPRQWRVEYFHRTIAKARNRADAPTPILASNGASASSNTDGPATPNSVAEPPTDPAMAKAILCQKISTQLGVVVLRLVKFEGKEPTYHMHLEQGIIEFASVDKLISYASVRSAIAAKVGRIIRKIKEKEWEQLSQMLLDACFVEECTEEEEFEGSARCHLLDYLRETDFIPSIEGQRVQEQRRPMIVGGHITVCSSDFAAYLNKTKAMNLSPKAAASMLGALGAKKTDKFRNTRLNRQSRWALPMPAFDPQEIKPGVAEPTQPGPTNIQEEETIQ